MDYSIKILAFNGHFIDRLVGRILGEKPLLTSAIALLEYIAKGLLTGAPTIFIDLGGGMYDIYIYPIFSLVSFSIKGTILGFYNDTEETLYLATYVPEFRIKRGDIQNLCLDDLIDVKIERPDWAPRYKNSKENYLSSDLREVLTKYFVSCFYKELRERKE